MSTKDQSTPAGDRGTIDEQLRKPDNFAPRRKKAPQKFWLHVHDDGSEKVYRRPPFGIPTLTVEIIDAVMERTWTRRAPFRDNSWVVVPPRGVGWSYEAPAQDGNSDSWTRVRGVRP
jgi:hypothetical protein